MRAFGTPVADSIAQKLHLTAQHLNDEAMEWGHRFSMKSGFTGSVPQEMVDGCLARLDEAPKGGDCSFTFWSMGACHRWIGYRRVATARSPSGRVGARSPG